MTAEHGWTGGIPRRRSPTYGPARYWLISKPRDDGTLVPRLTDHGRVLPVFSSGEEVAAFLREDTDLPSGGWDLEETGAGRLLSTLQGPPCAGVETVVLDPVAGLPMGFSVALVGVGRERFVEQLLGLHARNGGRGGAPAPSSRDGRR